MNKFSTILMAGSALALAACGSTMDEGGDMSSTMMAPAYASEYTVFFGFDRSDLSTLGAASVERATEATTATSATVSLVGHTDTSGSTAYNQALSEARAATVRAAMIAGGVSEAVISASGRGELDVAVDTGDGVREPRNRRVEITLADMMMVEAPAAEAPAAPAGSCVITRTGPMCVQQNNNVVNVQN